MAAHLVRQRYPHYLCHISGPQYDRRRTLRQQNNEVTGLHSTGTLLGHGLVRVVQLSQLFRCDTSCIWHDTPGQYMECTCKLITAKSSGETIAWQGCKQYHDKHGKNNNNTYLMNTT